MTEEQKKEIEKKGYLLEDFRLFHLKDAKGTSMEYHYHEFCKLVLFISGQGEYTVEDRHYELQTGDVLLIGSGQIHRPEFAKGVEYERVIIYISPEFLQRHVNPDCNPEELFAGKREHVLRVEEKRYKKLFEKVSMLEAELAGEAYGKRIMANSLLVQLLVQIGRWRENNQFMPPENRFVSDERIKRILAYLEEHFLEQLTVEELAERFFISRYHMMRLFKQETGQSLYGYITERRLFYARELLRQGISATESCFLAGFGSYSSFTRAYAKRFGTTPTGRNGRCIPMDETMGID